MNEADNKTMLKFIYCLPEQIERAVVLGKECPLFKKTEVENVVIAGMGGSAIGGDVVRAVMNEDGTLPVTVWRDYRLPAAVGEKTILVLSSYSGNTEETLTAYEDGQRRGAKIFVVASGGKIAEMAKSDHLPLLLVPMGMPPRTAIGYMSIPILMVMYRLQLCRDYTPDIIETKRLIKRWIDVWRRRANSLSRLILNRLPIIYSTARLLDVVAYRWQCQLNENAKVLCHSGQFPEQSHNEIMGFGAPEFLNRKVYLVIIVDKSSYPRTLLRLREIKRLIGKEWAGLSIIKSRGSSPLARIFSTVVMGDLVSVALARRRGVDPIGIHRIDELKKTLASKRKVK
ncbi:MAG: bifunctional phosphoglucose/phosphomannose isomerase [bacterium]